MLRDRDLGEAGVDQDLDGVAGEQAVHGFLGPHRLVGADPIAYSAATASRAHGT